MTYLVDTFYLFLFLYFMTTKVLTLEIDPGTY